MYILNIYIYIYIHIYVMLEKIPYYIPLVEFLKRLSIKAWTQLSWSSITCSATEN